MLTMLAMLAPLAMLALGLVRPGGAQDICCPGGTVLESLLLALLGGGLVRHSYRCSPWPSSSWPPQGVGLARHSCCCLPLLLLLLLPLLLLLLPLLLLLRPGVVLVPGIPRPVLAAILTSSIVLMVGMFFSVIVNIFIVVIKFLSFLCLQVIIHD